MPFAKLKSNLKANCAISSAACYDWSNDVIWVNNNPLFCDSKFSAYKNFGPGFIPNFNESYNYHSSLVVSRDSSIYSPDSHEAMLKTMSRVRYQPKTLDVTAPTLPESLELKSSSSEILNTFSEMPVDYMETDAQKKSGNAVVENLK